MLPNLSVLRVIRTAPETQGITEIMTRIPTSITPDNQSRLPDGRAAQLPGRPQ